MKINFQYKKYKSSNYKYKLCIFFSLLDIQLLLRCITVITQLPCQMFYKVMFGKHEQMTNNVQYY